MKETMRAAVMDTVGHIRFETRPVPAPGADEVLVRVKHVGICGSDMEYFQHGRIGSFVVEKPIVLGHEAAGIVAAVGAQVSRFAAGDAVALEPGIPCGRCEFCRQGRYNLCPDVRFLATPPYDGAFAEYIAYPQDMVYALPQGMDTVEGALLEPLNVGLHAAMTAQARLGQTAVVLGAGCIGLMTLLSLKAMGVSRVFVADIVAGRLEKAAALGADAVIRSDQTDAVRAVLDLTDGQGADLVFETAGNRVTTAQTCPMVKRGGKIVLVGMMPDAEAPFPFIDLIAKEAAILTVFRYRNLYPVGIQAVASGRIDLKKVVTHTFAFDEIQHAMEESIRNKREIVKAVVAF